MEATLKEYSVQRIECGVGGLCNYVTEVTFPPKLFCICDCPLFSTVQHPCWRWCIGSEFPQFAF